MNNRQFFKTKEEIAGWLLKNEIRKFKILDDLSVDVEQHVNIYNSDIEFLPVQFNEIHGDFLITSSLFTLFGCPDYVSRNFVMSSNKIQSLVGGPTKVLKNYDCSRGDLKSLNGLASQINGNLDFSRNNVTDIEVLLEADIRGKIECRGNVYLEKMYRICNSDDMHQYISAHKQKKLLEKEVHANFYKMNIPSNKYKI